MSALVEAYVASQYQVNNTYFSRPNYYNWWYIFVTNRGAFAVAAVNINYTFDLQKL